MPTQPIEPFKCRWGILACGWIASVFTKDLLVDPATRGVYDVQHIVQAAASSTSVDKAKKFLHEVGAPDATAYGSYEELVADPNVDVIYVATPHSHHYSNTLLALNAGKHVVCEKPFTVNAAQTKILVELAKLKGLFLMEAVWTRFFPLSIAVRQYVKDGKIGVVKRVMADLSLPQTPETHFPDSHRMVNPHLAGGCLLDLGLYPLTWVYQILYHTQPPEKRIAPIVTGSMNLYRTGVDDNTVVVCTWPDTIGIATTNLYNATDPNATGSPCVKIQGTAGEIHVGHPAYRPTKVTVIQGFGTEAVTETSEFPMPQGHGMHWEADAAARCLRDGKLEDDMMPLEESIIIMEAMDKVREISGLRYPQTIESLEQ
ncbi:putative Trans-1,2-dihydrobenzene-1,2-diol dehydrogenase [Kalaharituber pfeilii]|nr:putative Trans-1,2-dihydrobenzene-1,2-diol dehydrogenase [Kalaharituber pfeilii]